MTARVTLYAIAFVAGAIVLCHDTATHAADIPWKLDEKTAQALAALAAGDGANPGDLDPDLPTNDPPFFVFDGISPPPAEGSFGLAMMLGRWSAKPAKALLLVAWVIVTGIPDCS